ncbi:hypothetical protein [Pigmentiphaga aceris]|nr:hypothetical protein [Pigmentiphaga aceris]
MAEPSFDFMVELFTGKPVFELYPDIEKPEMARRYYGTNRANVC